MKPWVKQIQYKPVEQIFACFAQDDAAVLLDSAKQSEQGRYSFIAVDPFLTIISKNGDIQCADENFVGNPFDVLQKHLSVYQLETHQDLPPFQGGVAGFLSYDLYQHLETIPMHSVDDMNSPDMALGFYDLVIAFDHQLESAWVFASGFPETVESLRKGRAEQRMAELIQRISTTERVTDVGSVTNGAVTSNFSKPEYCQAVQTFIEYILAGDIFEANLTQRFKINRLPKSNVYALYCLLRKNNPAPFSSYMRFGKTIIASASPERFLLLKEGVVESRPIKGTARRDKDPQLDARLGQGLLESEKDRAENIMIVDLMRNDLSRVCRPHSVKVPQLCGLESFETVHHLVSVVEGRLEEGRDSIDLLKATFPGGSITGAPKIRAMEIIAECENVARGPYCGSVAYIGFDGSMDSSIVIRSFIVNDESIVFHAGGAVTSDSDPLCEYEESFTKIKPLLESLCVNKATPA